MSQAALDAYCQAAGAVVGNPSSMHWAGRAARRMLDDARDAIAGHLNCEAGALVFTSGGTESNNMAIHGALAGQTPGRIVTSAIEHPSVLQTLERFEQQGWELVRVRPQANGVIDAARFCDAIDADTKLACLMWANNESGTLQPVSEVADFCRERKVPLLVDAVQALGKLPLDLDALDADFVSLSAHKVGGAKGVGALVMRRGLKAVPYQTGGGQERGRRSGTENVAGVVAFAAALQACRFEACADVRDHFEARLLDAMPDVIVHGREAARLANTSMFSVPGMDGETLLMQLDLAGFAVASGSACSSGKREPSHVLLAMGIPERMARASLRVSYGPEHSKADAEALVAELERVRGLLRHMAGL
jgi:cysteine desulfurase